ncbi:LCP family protein [Candidatus Mycobacterium wuenschmannii]|uniref:LCP family protein n=1 Tax=Candidatus Mycobacterium wuenschmannii TaxID=3027808 RepID=A0ABY8VSC2_9MYCO|nr:LCP family protein [Candidatus Mycobacterium wuenschmannii]WIM86221.1 LCP family protein [Candidatus Mycobacterium wuenschmannii]
MGTLQQSNPKHRLHATPPQPRRHSLAHAIGAIVAVGALLMTGSGYWMAHGVLSGITVSQALSPEDPKSTGDGMNILLIGLDSRKDQNGDDLPWSVLKHLHAGDSDDGGYNTNTLILAHIGPDDKVSAFSIPRDDWVSWNGVPGYNHIKIKEAYGLTKQYVEQKMIDKGVSDQKQLETKGREAARAATLKAVRKLTGAPIDYFAEVNLAGFYDLANSLGGIEVCLKHAVYDDYSGADFPAGRQTLDAAQALAFVRQRHGLDNGDLDRTHRQQAFLSSVMRQLQDSGTFTNIGKLKDLMAVARKDVVLSAGWDEGMFRKMGALAGGSMEYRTLPVVRYDNINGQDVNIVDPAAIKTEVAAAFGSSTTSSTTLDAPSPSTVVDVVNASSTSGLASKVARTLKHDGYTTGSVRDRVKGEPTSTTIEYAPGADNDAKEVASLLGIDAPDKPNRSLQFGHVEVVVDDSFSVPAQDEALSDSTSETTTTPDLYGNFKWRSSVTTSADPIPDRGAPIDGGGVPCVN